MDRCFFFSLICFSLVSFQRNLAQIVKRGRSTYVQNILSHSFNAFEVMTHFVAEERFLNKSLATLFEYNSCDLNIEAFFFLQSVFNYKL